MLIFILASIFSMTICQSTHLAQALKKQVQIIRLTKNI